MTLADYFNLLGEQQTAPNSYSPLQGENSSGNNTYKRYGMLYHGDMFMSIIRIRFSLQACCFAVPL